MLNEAVVVNTITAGPLLNLMLALQGMEYPEDPKLVWPIFKRFASIPSGSDLDVVSFQVAWRQEGRSLGARYSWTRQLRDDAPGYGPVDRIVEVVFAYAQPLPGSSVELELWSDQYPSLDAFFADVERTAEFAYLLKNAPNGGSVVVEDIDDRSEGDYEE